MVASAVSGSLRSGLACWTRVPTQVAPDVLTAWSSAEASPPSIGPSRLGSATRLETRMTVTRTPPTINRARVLLVPTLSISIRRGQQARAVYAPLGQQRVPCVREPNKCRPVLFSSSVLRFHDHSPLAVLAGDSQRFLRRESEGQHDSRRRPFWQPILYRRC